MRPASRTPRATIPSGWLLLCLGYRPPPIQLSAKTSYLDGRSRSFRTTIILPDTRTSISAGTSTSQRTVLSCFPGGFARHVATSCVLTRDPEQNMQNRQPDAHWIKEPDRGKRTGRRFCSRATLCHWSGFRRSQLVPLRWRCHWPELYDRVQHHWSWCSDQGDQSG